MSFLSTWCFFGNYLLGIWSPGTIFLLKADFRHSSTELLSKLTKTGPKTIFRFQFPPFPPFQCWVWFFIHENKSEQYSPTLNMGGEGGNEWLGKNRRWKLITQILKMHHKNSLNLTLLTTNFVAECLKIQKEDAYTIESRKTVQCVGEHKTSVTVD